MAVVRKGKDRLGYSHIRVIVALVISATLFAVQFFIPSVIIERLDGIAYDSKLSLIPPISDALANIQIVDIDERTLLEVERMPWRRDLYAQLTTELTELGAIVITYDILFSEPQPNPAEAVLDDLARDKLLGSADDKTVDQTRARYDYDTIFANSIRRNEVVLGTLLHQQSDINKGELNAMSVRQQNSTLTDFVTTYSGFSGVIPVLSEPSAGNGFMNSVEDADGFVRRAALIAKVDNQYFPSLAAEAFRVYSLADQLIPIWSEVNQQRFLAGVQIGQHTIKTDNEGRILIPFKGPQKTYPYTSAVDILKGNAEPKQFDQAIVFVGTSASGLADLRVTPVAVNFPGVEIHATIFEAMFAPEKLIYRPDWWKGALAVQLIVISGIIIFGFALLSPTVMSIAALIMIGITISVNLVLWRVFALDIPLTSPLVLTILLSGLYITSGFLSEAKRRQRVKAIFDTYVPPAHIDTLLENKNDSSLSGEKREMTVMFSDIRGFTSISESMEAHELKQWLNQFFSPITKAIFECEGTIDKYVGDMVMAFWGAPLRDDQHANHAIKASFEMLAETQRINQTFVQQGLPVAAIGIGINTGEMNVGDMGSHYRRAYTVIGDAVNLGSRLEGLTKFYGVDILVSETTKEQANHFNFLTVDKVKVKGKAQPVTIYTPVNPEQELSDADVLFNAAMASYFAMHFDSASALFKQVGSDFQFPILLTRYLERCRTYCESPPGEDWDGSFTHTTK